MTVIMTGGLKPPTIFPFAAGCLKRHTYILTIIISWLSHDCYHDWWFETTNHFSIRCRLLETSHVYLESFGFPIGDILELPHQSHDGSMYGAGILMRLHKGGFCWWDPWHTIFLAAPWIPWECWNFWWAIPSGKLTQLLKMVIYSGFSH